MFEVKNGQIDFGECLNRDLLTMQQVNIIQGHFSAKNETFST